MPKPSPRVYIPANLGELLSYYRQYPDSLLWAGGTAVGGLFKHREEYRAPKSIISIPSVRELKNISRNERYLEIGAAVSYNKILEVGQHVLPKALSQALLALRPHALRNLATIAGNVAVPSARLNIYPVLLLLDARVELRREGKSRWISVHHLFDRDGAILLGQGELITRFRIPFEERELDYFRQIGSPSRNRRAALLFCATGKIVKGTLLEFRCTFANYRRQLIRNLELEAQLTGKKLPLSRKDREDTCALMASKVQDSPGISPFQRDRAAALFSHFLENLRSPE